MPTLPDPREVVARGYDQIAERYAAWVRDDVFDTVVPRYLGQVIELLPAGGTVLDLGCGGGERLAHLARHFTTTGVDISPEQVKRAHCTVPDARVVQGDMTRLDFPPASFDAVTAFYAFTHLPHGELPGLLVRIAQWLRPSGVLVASMGTTLNTGAYMLDWLGAPSYFSGYDTTTNRLLVEQAGFHILSARQETIRETLDGRSSDAEFFWVVARRVDTVSAPDTAWLG
jgi:predicted TPR repeat methyltransferase